MKEIDLSQLNDISYIKSWVFELLEVETHSEAIEMLSHIYKFHLHDATDLSTDSWPTIWVSKRKAGREGGGEDCELIFAIAPCNTKTISHLNSTEVENALVYFRISGYYSSYEGTTWDSAWEIVAPKVVTTLSFTRA